MIYKYLLWDLDGTIMNSKKGIVRCIQYALESLNHPCPPEQELDWVIGPPLFDSFYKLLDTEDENLVNEAIRLYRERYRTKGMYEHEVFLGVRELLSDLHGQGFINLLATSKAQVFADQILNHFNLKSYFSGGHGSELNGHLGEKKALINAVLKQVPEGDRGQCLMIGDRFYDVCGAKENQIDVMAVGYGYGSREELTEAGATYYCTSVEELRRFFIGD